MLELFPSPAPATEDTADSISTNSSNREYPLPEISPLCARSNCRRADCQASPFIEAYIYLPSKVFGYLPLCFVSSLAQGQPVIPFRRRFPLMRTGNIWAVVWCPILAHELEVDKMNQDNKYYEFFLLNGDWNPFPLSWEPIIEYSKPCTKEFIILRAPSMTDDECIGLPQLVTMLQRVAEDSST